MFHGMTFLNIDFKTLFFIHDLLFNQFVRIRMAMDRLYLFTWSMETRHCIFIERGKKIIILFLRSIARKV